MKTAEERAATVVRIHETGIAGKWAVGFRTPDGVDIETCCGMDTQADAAAVARGFQRILANAIRAAVLDEREACAQAAELCAAQGQVRSAEARAVAVAIRFRAHRD